jgi:cytidine deaminase
VETIDGQIHGGSNVENASLTLTVHAEAAAILAAIAAGALERCGREFIRTVYVSCPSGAHTGPCGLCRQSIREFAAPGCMVIGHDSTSGEIARDTLTSLLPKSFGPEDLLP